MTDKNKIVRSEKEILDDIKKVLPHVRINYGELQKTIESIYLAEYARENKDSYGLDKKNRESLMDQLGETIEKNHKLFKYSKDLKDVLFVLALKNLENKEGINKVEFGVYHGEKKNLGVVLPELNIEMGNGDKIKFKVSAHTERDKDKDYGETEILNTRIKGVLITKNGKEISGDKLDNKVLSKFAKILKEGSFGDTFGMDKFNQEFDSNEDRELLRDEKIKKSSKVIEKSFEEIVYTVAFNTRDIREKKDFSPDKVENEGLTKRKKVATQGQKLKLKL